MPSWCKHKSQSTPSKGQFCRPPQKAYTYPFLWRSAKLKSTPKAHFPLYDLLNFHYLKALYQGFY